MTLRILRNGNKHFLFLVLVALVVAWYFPWGARDLEPPGTPVKPPTAGTLFVAGGGATTDEIAGTFLKLAYGHALAIGDKPAGIKLVVIPTASGDYHKPDISAELEKTRAFWHRSGVSELVILHTTDRRIAMDPAFSAPLCDAHAVWMGGGKQERLAAIYCGTPVELAMIELLNRGGVVGGTSAGTAILSRVMIEGGKGIPKISKGFCFSTDTIFDQHFLAENREDRLLCAQEMEGHEHLCGLGVDEGAAVVWPIKDGVSGAYRIGSSTAYYYKSVKEQPVGMRRVEVPQASPEVLAMFKP